MRVLRRDPRIGIEIGPEFVRGLALGEGERLLAAAERPRGGAGDAAAALGEVSAELGSPARVQLLVSGVGERLVQFHLPRVSGRRLEQGIRQRTEQELGRPLAGFTWSAAAKPAATGITTAVSVLSFPREPLESWCSLLACAGQRVEGVHSPLGLLVAGFDGGGERAERELRVDLLESETRFAVFDGGLVSASEILPRPAAAAIDPLRAIEQRRREAAALTRLAGVGVERILLRGPAELAGALAGELGSAVVQAPVVLCNPWDGVDAPNLDAAARQRLTGALTAARSAESRLAAVPGATLVDRRSRSRFRLAAAGVLLVAIGCAAAGWGLAREREGLLRRREAALAALARAGTSAGVESDAELAPLPPQAHDWSQVLREAGLIARPGINYDRLVLDLCAAEPTIGIVGRASAGDGDRAALLIGALHGELMSTRLGTGLPRLAAGTEGSSEARLRFALERDLRRDEGTSP